MSAPRPALLLLALSLPLAAGALLAQDRSGPRTASLDEGEVAPPDSVRPARPPLRDPFRGPPALEGNRPIGPGSQAPVRPRLPAVKLLGLIEVKGRAPAALLEIDKSVCVVRAGDLISIEGPGAPAEVEVLEVGRSRVRVSFFGEQREVR